MSNKSLLDEIAARIKRKKEVKEKVASRDENIEAFAMSLIDEVEDMVATATNPSLLNKLVPMYAKSFEARVQAIDRGATVDVQWSSDANGVPRINGVLIKWSPEYQTKRNCEEQLFVDMTSLLLK
jgi:sugar-specific transcriptional regulator TrmB